MGEHMLFGLAVPSDVHTQSNRDALPGADVIPGGQEIGDPLNFGQYDAVGHCTGCTEAAAQYMPTRQSVG